MNITSATVVLEINHNKNNLPNARFACAPSKV